MVVFLKALQFTYWMQVKDANSSCWLSIVEEPDSVQLYTPVKMTLSEAASPFLPTARIKCPQKFLSPSQLAVDPS